MKKYTHPALTNPNPKRLRYHVSLVTLIGKFPPPLRYPDFVGLVTKEQYEAIEAFLEGKPSPIELVVTKTAKEDKVTYKQKTIGGYLI